MVKKLLVEMDRVAICGLLFCSTRNSSLKRAVSRHNQNVSWGSVLPVYRTLVLVRQVPLPWREEEPWSFCLTGLLSAKVLFVMFLGCKATLFDRESEYFTIFYF